MYRSSMVLMLALATSLLMCQNSEETTTNTFNMSCDTPAASPHTCTEYYNYGASAVEGLSCGGSKSTEKTCPSPNIGSCRVNGEGETFSLLVQYSPTLPKDASKDCTDNLKGTWNFNDD